MTPQGIYSIKIFVSLGACFHDPSTHLQHSNFCITLSRFWVNFRSNYSQFYLNLPQFWVNFNSIFGSFSLIFNEFIINFQWFSLNFNQGVVQELFRNLLWNWPILLSFLGQISLIFRFWNERNISLQFSENDNNFSLIRPRSIISICVHFWPILVHFGSDLLNFIIKFD